ncbi:MAG TPA: serine/threonine-protein kinase, partial [Gemmataceae bacterium]|nr:serine/threonine-protein kinase [Gemmataceae bacterium]
LSVGILAKLFGSGKKKKPNLPIVDIKKRFELGGRTGQGSMSKVYRAYDKKLARTVCLKVLDKEKTAKFEARFAGMDRPTEGAICMALRHPHIVKTFEFGMTTAREPFVVMEWIEGVGLNFLIETRSRNLDGKRLEYLLQLTDAIDYLHKQRYLHRDICPRNVMINQEGAVKVIDFGLTIPYTAKFCRPGNRTGTNNYLAPELIKRTTTDHRVDLFALGVTAYEVFTGDLPWEKAQSLQTLLNHMNTPGKNPREFRPELDDHLVRLLVKSIEREPNRRFQTAADFRDALKALPKQDY